MNNSADWGRQIQLSFYSGPRHLHRAERRTYETAFVPGTIDDIHDYAKHRETERWLPAWSFSDSRDGWLYLC